MYRFRPVAPKKEGNPTEERRPVFAGRRVEPPLESAFIFPASGPKGLRIHDGKKGKRPVPKDEQPT